jgi:enoyl-CoA hydratase/carnithine racemase
MPFGEVLRMSLLGNHERISAARALEIGLVSEVTPPAELQAAAHRIAAAIASQPPTAVQATLRTLWMAREVSRSQATAVGNTFLNLAMTEQALAEGQTVFSSKQRIEPRIR